MESSSFSATTAPAVSKDQSSSLKFEVIRDVVFLSFSELPKVELVVSLEVLVEALALRA